MLQFILLFTVFVISNGQLLQAPVNVNVNAMNSTSISISFNASASASSYNVEINAVNNVTDITEQAFTTNTVLIPNLQGNTAYGVRVQSVNGTNKSNYSATYIARTAPTGASITSHIATPTFITVFLEQVSGARSWLVEYVDTISGDVQTLETPAQGPTKSLYLAVLTGLTPNTRYRVRARITKILGTNFTASQSPFGEYKNITTEKNSLFGRLTLLNRNLSNSDSNKAALSTELTAAYKNITSRVSEVKVVEIEEGNISHHEILVNDRSINPSTLNLLLNQPSLYLNEQIRFNAAGPNAYYYGFPRDPTWLIFGSTVASCQATDTRKWVFHSDNGIMSSLQFEKTSDARFGSVLNLNFNKNNLTTVIGRTENVVFGMAPNSVYGIRFDYLVKFCPADGNNTMFYDRIFMSNASGVKEVDKYTITYTTGPAAIDSKNIEIFPVGKQSFNSTTVSVGFNVKSVPKANFYRFSIETESSVVLANITKMESEIDSSEYVQIISPVELSIGTKYNLITKVQTLLANGTNAESPESTFEFYTDPPNITVPFRIVEILDDQFTVTWSVVNFATQYEIYTRKGSYLLQTTVGACCSAIVQNVNLTAEIYNVTMAPMNLFGKSAILSGPKTTRPWEFYGINATQFSLRWDTDPADYNYSITTSPPVPTISFNRGLAYFSGLEGGIVYTVNVSFTSASGISTLYFSAKQQTAPEVVVGPWQITSSLHSLTIAWSSLRGVNEYHTLLNSTDGVITKSTVVLTPEVTFSGLAAGRRYEIQVRGSNSAGNGKFGTTVTYTGVEIPTILGTSSNLSLSTFLVTWTSSVDANSYIVNVTNTISKSVVSFSVNTTFFLVPNLDSGTTYSVTVAAVYEIGETNQSLPVLQKTILSPPSLNYTFMSNGYNVRIFWPKSRGADRYNIKYNSSESTQTSGETTNSTTFDIIDVYGNTDYDVIATAIDLNGQSKESRIMFRTGMLSPENVSVVNVTSSSIVVKWRTIKGASQYQIRVMRLSNSAPNISNSSSSRDNLIDNLESGMDYKISVVAVYSGGNSKFSDDFKLTTALQNPLRLFANNVTNSTLSLQWKTNTKAISYRAMFFQSGILVGEKSVSTPPAIFVGLLSGTTYTVTLYTSSNLGPVLGVMENRQLAPVDTIITAPNPPFNISTNNWDGRNVTIMWDANPGSVSFTLLIRGINQQEVFRSNYSTAERILRVTLQQPAYTYLISIRATNSQGHHSLFSEPIELRTRQPINLLDSSNVRCLAQGHNRLASDEFQICNPSAEGAEVVPRTWVQEWWWILLICGSLILVSLCGILFWVLRYKKSVKGEYDLDNYRKSLGYRENGETFVEEKKGKYDLELRRNQLGYKEDGEIIDKPDLKSDKKCSNFYTEDPQIEDLYATVVKKKSTLIAENCYAPSVGELSEDIPCYCDNDDECNATESVSTGSPITMQKEDISSNNVAINTHDESSDKLEDCASGLENPAFEKEESENNDNALESVKNVDQSDKEIDIADILNSIDLSLEDGDFNAKTSF